MDDKASSSSLKTWATCIPIQFVVTFTLTISEMGIHPIHRVQ